MGYESKVVEVLEDSNIRDCYFENGSLIVPGYVGVDRVVEVLETSTKHTFYHLPTILVEDGV